LKNCENKDCNIVLTGSWRMGLLQKIMSYQDWKITTKITVLAVTVVILFGMVTFFYVLPKAEEKMWQDKADATRNIVDLGYSIISHYADRVKSGEFSMNEGQQRALATIRSMRYEGANYLWITDRQSVMLMHPIRPEMEGKDQSGYKDPNGKQFFTEMSKVCEEHGDGFVTYVWNKPNSTQPSPKISYVKLFKSWGWILGSGIYVDDVKTEINSLRAITTIGMVLAAIFACAFGIFIGRKIAQPIHGIVEQMDNGDLNLQFNSTRHDEIGSLQRSFDQFIGSLRETLFQVSEASAAVASASAEISSSTEEMAAGGREQTSQAGEVAKSVDEMIKTIMDNSKNSATTAATARKAREAAEQGGKVVDDTIHSMQIIAKVVKQSSATVQELGRSSDQIGEIANVIDDIADQTNLLALNAAIEAARAGEQGRGFAVVADEVRKLAERTTKATKEIAVMIKKIQSETQGAVIAMNEGTDRVDEGIKQADKAGNSLREIVDIARQVTDSVNQIAAASEEQSSASEQINKNVDSISKVTAETAQSTQQIAQATEDLNRLTENLQRLVEKFKLSEEAHGSVAQQKYSKVHAAKEHSQVSVRSNGSLVHRSN
jgi:methyl-accepting chemotaxis protein